MHTFQHYFWGIFPIFLAFSLENLNFPPKFSNKKFKFKQEDRKSVFKKCVTSEPRYGDLWQSVSKDPINWRRTTEEILQLATQKIKVPT